MIRANEPDNELQNVLGGPLQSCSLDPMTGFYRTGCCQTGPDDLGSHTVCVLVTDEFLAFSKAAGNDLSTPRLANGTRANEQNPKIFYSFLSKHLYQTLY